MAGKNRSAYSKEFREDAVRLYRSSVKSILSVSNLTPERARAAGALTLFALPARRLALVARRGRAA